MTPSVDDAPRGYSALVERAGAGAAPAADFLDLVGPDAARFLNGYVTCDVRALVELRHVRGFVTGREGRVLADLDLVALPGRLRLRLPAGLGETVRAHLGKYLLADRVELEPVAGFARLRLAGPAAPAVLAAAGLRGADAGWRAAQRARWSRAPAGRHGAGAPAPFRSLGAGGRPRRLRGRADRRRRRARLGDRLRDAARRGGGARLRHRLRAESSRRRAATRAPSPTRRGATWARRWWRGCAGADRPSASPAACVFPGRCHPPARSSSTPAARPAARRASPAPPAMARSASRCSTAGWGKAAAPLELEGGFPAELAPLPSPDPERPPAHPPGWRNDSAMVLRFVI